MKRRFVLVDVFADRPFAGNPLAVFPEAQGLSDASLQAIAREMDHPATAFLFPSDLSGAAFRLRIFSPEQEIAFAGHPALGAHFVHAIESRLPLTEPVTRVAHEGAEGLFQVELKIEAGQIALLRLKHRAPQIGPRLPTAEVARLARALGLEEEEIAATNQPVRVASTGLPVLIVPVSTLDALGGARPRFGDLREILTNLPRGSKQASIVYAFTKETRSAQAAAHARAFDTVSSIEIPGAGAAAGALAAYLISQAAITVLPVNPLMIEQGHVLSRPSTIFIEAHVKDAKIAAIIMGGRVIRVGDGTLEV